MAKGIYLTFTDCTDLDREEEFNRWYTHAHLPHMMEARGVVSARRFVQATAGEGPARYLALYELESDDLAATVDEMRRIGHRSRAEGTHIGCITGPGGYIYEEIEPGSLTPLERVDYPKLA